MSQEFLDRFRFDPSKHLFVGVERECFFVRDGAIVPEGPTIIPQPVPSGVFSGAYGYELSACQLELRTKPTQLPDLENTLLAMDAKLREDQVRLGFRVAHREVAPFDMPLDVYPDPSGRYQEITRDMPIEILRAACRVAGTHVHIGMGSPAQAIKAYNAARQHVPMLCAIGDNSSGERLSIYRIVKPALEPPPYADWDAYEQYAQENGFWGNPRDCWHIVRISAHGTIEFRMFGATPNPREIVTWASLCHMICRVATT